jgi:hypothetical protein
VSGPELGHVINLLEVHCPQALHVSEHMRNKLEISFDDITIFAQVSKYAAEKAAQRKRRAPSTDDVTGSGQQRKSQRND